MSLWINFQVIWIIRIVGKIIYSLVLLSIVWYFLFFFVCLFGCFFFLSNLATPARDLNQTSSRWQKNLSYSSHMTGLPIYCQNFLINNLIQELICLPQLYNTSDVPSWKTECDLEFHTIVFLWPCLGIIWILNRCYFYKLKEIYIYDEINIFFIIFSHSEGITFY